MNKWARRWEAILNDFSQLKTMIKQEPAGLWTPEYRELAEKIHSVGRDRFHTELVVELLNEKEQGSPLEEAYRAMSKVQAMFPHCLWCGRAAPGHCQDTCAVIKVWAAIRKESQ